MGAARAVPLVQIDGTLFGLCVPLEKLLARRELQIPGNVFGASLLDLVAMRMLAQVFVVEQNPEIETRLEIAKLIPWFAACCLASAIFGCSSISKTHQT